MESSASGANANASQAEEIDKIEKHSAFTFSDQPSLENIRQMQQEFADERDWNQHHTPRNLFLALVGEVGEVSELFQWRGECKVGLPDWSDSDREHLGEELSDVLIYLISLANKCHINLPEAVLRKIALNKKKYPLEKVFGSCKKHNEYHDPESDVKRP